MPYYYEDPPEPDISLSPEQTLAAAVIRQAVTDARLVGSDRIATARRDEARAFLFGARGAVWCHVAGLDVEAVRTLAARVLQQPLRARRNRARSGASLRPGPYFDYGGFPGGNRP
jgi:hypothetical protein